MEILKEKEIILKDREAQPVETDTVQGQKFDPLGEHFEQSLQEGRPQHKRVESAAIKRLRAGEGVMSNLPRERGQLPKGVQPGFITEVINEDETHTMAAVTIAEMDELEPSYDEARMRSDWPQWRTAIDVELQNLKDARTWLKKDAKGNIIKWKAWL